jgi:hypothetical protein
LGLFLKTKNPPTNPTPRLTTTAIKYHIVIPPYCINNFKVALQLFATVDVPDPAALRAILIQGEAIGVMVLADPTLLDNALAPREIIPAQAYKALVFAGANSYHIVIPLALAADAGAAQSHTPKVEYLSILIPSE